MKTTAALTIGILALSGLQLLTAATATVTNTKDIYFQSDLPTTNQNSRKAMMIAGPTLTQNRTEETLMGFDTTTIKSSFDTTYGSGNWTITSISLTLKSESPTAGVQPPNAQLNKINGGDFQLSWSADDSWTEAGINWSTSGGYLGTTESLGTFSYLADGTVSLTWDLTLSSGLVADIQAGSTASIFGTPTAGSQVGYLFQTRDYPTSGFGPVLSVSAVPEPTAAAFFALAAMAGLWCLRRRV